MIKYDNFRKQKKRPKDSIVKSLNELSTQNSALGNKLHAGAFISVHSWAIRSLGGVKHCALVSTRNYIAVCLLRSFKSTEVQAHACFFVRIHCEKPVGTSVHSRPETEGFFFFPL